MFAPLQFGSSYVDNSSNSASSYLEIYNFALESFNILDATKKIRFLQF